MTARPSSLCALAGNWSGDLPDGGAMVERKHDGWRLLYIDGQCFTRNGMPYRGIRHIERALAVLQRQFDRPAFFDGEFVVGTGIHTLAQTKEHQDSGWKGGDAGTLWLFDAVPLDAWKRDDCEMPLYERKNALEWAIVGMMDSPEAWEMGWTEGVECPVRLVPDQWAFDRGDVKRMALDVWARGGEGVLVKDASTPYRRNRSPAWAKYRRPVEERMAA